MVKNGRPVVSVITPVYNGGRYLSAAIDSLFAQTFADWELIAIDDGSTDETLEILRSYDDPRVRYVWQKNAGESAARNRGLSMARGEFVSFLDADDMYLPNALADMTRFLYDHQHYDVVFSNGYVCDEDGTTLTELSDHRPGIHQGHILEPLILHSSVITVPVCTLTRRAAIQRAQVVFDSRLMIGPDWDFWIRLARTATFGYLDAMTCKYRVHLSNVTRRSGRQRRQADLITGRLKLLRSGWFDELSVDTRRLFLQDLLIGLLSGEADRQRSILTSGECAALPSARQADLWRRVAIDHLVRGGNGVFATVCLGRAIDLSPTDRKSLVLRRLVTVPGGRAMARALLRTWSRLHSAAVRLRRSSALRPKAVPAALHPVGD